ncbi:hypothetical protein TRFO_30764 [Tritrichomonas foetus]|uniref:aspartyl aminopeptidase n=1 Tax=Tritrichomonas foetus TaxID=1144522 RepID=A0A1J4JSW3_9EUKA|nr:hypothetical protein TRFO_30764 [Tritrichomonas foetus]|eukprot:OHT02201.1 hypothetical protein TRFO_30764 [Tritrichomonas foetus]
MESIASFVDRSPTPMHFIHAAKEHLENLGFEQIYESEDFPTYDLSPKNKYFMIRNDTSIIAFDSRDFENRGSIFATNLDHPYFKIIPNGCRVKSNAEILNVSEYGYGMWCTWMDRDLSIAGKVRYKTWEGKIETKLISSENPICTIPSLASHLTTGPRNTCNLNIEDHLKPIVRFTNEDQIETDDTFIPSLIRFICDECNCADENIIDYELYVISGENSSKIGVNDEIFASQRISSIVQAAAGLLAFTSNSPPSGTNIYYCYSHECVIGSSTTSFDSNFLQSAFKKIPTFSYDFFLNCILFGGVRIPSAYTNPGCGVAYREGTKADSQPHHAEMVKILKKLDSIGQPYQQCSTTYDINNGIHHLIVSLSIPAVYFGIPVISLHSIREAAFEKDILAFQAAVNCFFQIDHEEIKSDDSLSY